MKCGKYLCEFGIFFLAYRTFFDYQEKALIQKPKKVQIFFFGAEKVGNKKKVVCEFSL